MKLIEEYPDVLKVDDVKEILQIGRNSAYNFIYDNRIPHIKIGKNIRIYKQNLVKFLEEGYDRNISEIAISEGGIGNER